jgi:hypothetical protein
VEGGDARADTWEWDGEVWTQVADTGPSARRGHALAFDSVRARVLLFGGRGASALGDTWAWDGEAWTQVADTGPSPRNGHAMCFEENDGRAILFGGSEASDTWSWDGESWTQLNDVGPTPCDGTRLVSTGHSSILFGGRRRLGSPSRTEVFGLTWELVDTDWTERQNMGPGPRHRHGMAFDGARRRVVLYAGRGAAGGTLGDTWELPIGD